MRMGESLLDGAWIAEADFGTAPQVEAALHEAISNNFLGYMPTWLVERTLYECRQFQADRFGVTLAEDCYGIAPDVLSVLHQVIEQLTDKGTPVIVPTPAYMPFLTIPGSHFRATIQVPSHVDANGRYKLDLERIDRAFSDGAQLLILCNPWNPTGQTFTREELVELASVVHKHPQAIVFSDEIHSPLVHADRTHIPFASLSEQTASRTVTATAASKGWNIPGLNCAQWYIAGSTLKERFARGSELLASGASPLGALGACVAYRDGRDWLDDFNAYIVKNSVRVQELLADSGSRLRCTSPQATYLTWWDASAYEVNNPAELIASKAAVAVNAGHELGEDYSRFFRLNLASPTPVLEDMVSRILAAFAN